MDFGIVFSTEVYVSILV